MFKITLEIDGKSFECDNSKSLYGGITHSSKAAENKYNESVELINKPK
jgi:hypothetical protein